MEKDEMKRFGYICMGPKPIDGPLFEIYYDPTPEQIENIQKFFGWTYLTEEEFMGFSQRPTKDNSSVPSSR